MRENKLFVEFLKKEGLLEKFEYNLKHIKGRDLDFHLQTIKEQSEKIPYLITKYDQLACGFRWNISEEGHDFWKQVNKKWREWIMKQ